MNEHELSEKQTLFKQYLERCIRNKPCIIKDVINNKICRTVGEFTFGLTDREMDEVAR